MRDGRGADGDGEQAARARGRPRRREEAEECDHGHGKEQVLDRPRRHCDELSGCRGGKLVKVFRSMSTTEYGGTELAIILQLAMFSSPCSARPDSAQASACRPGQQGWCSASLDN